MIETLVKEIKKANKIVVLTGAGISTESGIPDFRSSNGLYKNNRKLQVVLSKDYFEGKPKEFWPIYKDVFGTKMIGNYHPNYGHQFIVELEAMGKNVSVITQNVDGLHIAAGSTDVIEMHGTVKTAFCPKCKTEYDLEYIGLLEIPRCNHKKGNGNICDFILKPSVVLFGDRVNHFYPSVYKVMESDLLLILGTSLQVPPFSTLPIHYGRGFFKDKKHFVKSSNPDRKIAIINYEPTNLDETLDIVINSSISKTLKEVSEFLKV